MFRWCKYGLCVGLTDCALGGLDELIEGQFSMRSRSAIRITKGFHLSLDDFPQFLAFILSGLSNSGTLVHSPRVYANAGTSTFVLSILIDNRRPWKFWIW